MALYGKKIKEMGSVYIGSVLPFDTLYLNIIVAQYISGNEIIFSCDEVKTVLSKIFQNAFELNTSFVSIKFSSWLSTHIFLCKIFLHLDTIYTVRLIIIAI